MDLLRIAEANALIQQGVQQDHPRTLCSFTGLLQEPGIPHGYLRVGNVGVCIHVHQVCTRPPDPQPTGRHAIIVSAVYNTKRKLFRETAEGWFSFDRIVAYVLECLRTENQQRVEQEAKRLLRVTAENQAKQLKSAHRIGNDSKVDVTFKDTALCLNFSGLTYDQATSILTLADSLHLIRTKTNEVRELWDHLQDDDI